MQEVWFHPWVGKIPWRRAWQCTPVFLTGESHGQRRLAGYSTWGCKEWDSTEATQHTCSETSLIKTERPCQTATTVILSLHVLMLTLCSVSSVAQLCLTLCNPMNHSTPGLPVHHQLPEFTQTHVHWVGDAIQPSYPLLSPSPLPPSLPASGSFPVSQLFAWGGPSIGVSASASVLPMNTQDWSPLG